MLEKSVRYDGLLLTVDYSCSLGHRKVWHSGPSKHRQPLINAEVVGAAKMSGIGFTGLQELFQLLEMPIISGKTFYNLAKRWLYPLITEQFTRMKSEIIRELRSTGNLVLCGDAQFDSPGYSAKFCTYTIMDCTTNKVVDTIVIQKGQYEGELEKQACRELLNILINEDKLDIAQFVNDRHQGIAKMMREEFEIIFHGFDIWHVAKSLRKQLTKVTKKHPIIVLWSDQVVNHFWWSCENCGKSPELLIEMFHSLLFHVLNIHCWGRKKLIHGQFERLRGKRPYPTKPTRNMKCWHTNITKRVARKGKWFKISDDAFKALFKIVTSTRLSNDMKKCSEFLHTGSLESLHSTKIKYLPKSTAYTMTTNIVMTMFAVLIHNTLLEITPSKKYEVVEYSRASKQHRLKSKVTKDIMPFKKVLMSKMMSNIALNIRIPLDLSSHIRRPVPKTFHGVEKPSKDTLKARRFSRMGKDGA